MKAHSHCTNGPEMKPLVGSHTLDSRHAVPFITNFSAISINASLIQKFLPQSVVSHIVRVMVV